MRAGNAPTKRGGSDGKGKGSKNRPKRHERPIAAAARRMGRRGFGSVSPYGSRSSEVGECCRWRLSSMSIEIFGILARSSDTRIAPLSLALARSRSTPL
eukprot:scaffold9957_cov44-Phaeocystis_antarctica.AAC.3